MKKVFMIIGGIFVGVVVLFVGLFALANMSSNKFVCKSEKGNITIMYNDEKLVGYTARGISYDLEQQNGLVEKIGVEEYLKEFELWFKDNTNGTCTKEEK